MVKRGFAYILLLIFLVTMSIAALEIQPIVSKDFQREKEQLYFHILKEYSVAAQKFKSYYGRFPSSISQLATKPPNPRFLRNFYKDPYADEKDSSLSWDTVIKSGKTGGIISVKTKTSAVSLGGVPLKSYYYDESGILKSDVKIENGGK